MAYFVEYGVYDVVTHMLEARDLADTPANRAEIERELRTGGYHIYLTVKPDIQNTVQQTITEWQNYPRLRNSAASEITDPNSGITSAQPQAASVIIDQHTAISLPWSADVKSRFRNGSSTALTRAVCLSVHPSTACGLRSRARHGRNAGNMRAEFRACNRRLRR